MSKRKNAIRNSYCNDSIWETFNEIPKEKTNQDIEFIYSNLSNHFVFNALKEQEM